MKKLDFSGDFLSVIRGLVGMVPKHPKNLFFFFETTKRQISAKILPIHAILTKSCDKISCFYRAYLTI
ncbi:hypothetical protein AOH408_09210 [Helicobacter pylori]